MKRFLPVVFLLTNCGRNIDTPPMSPPVDDANVVMNKMIIINNKKIDTCFAVYGGRTRWGMMAAVKCNSKVLEHVDLTIE